MFEVRNDQQALACFRNWCLSYRMWGRFGHDRAGDFSRLQAVWRNRTKEELSVDQALAIARELYAEGMGAMEV